MAAGMAMTQTGDKPDSCSKAIMCAGKAEVTDMVSTMNKANNQKGGWRRCSRTEVKGAASCAAEGSIRVRGAPCSSQPCKGAHTNSCSAASAHSACRQPHRSIHQANSGMNTVLAKPPKKVSVMMARRKSCGKRRVTTAKTGLYKVAAIPKPSQIQAA